MSLKCGKSADVARDEQRERRFSFRNVLEVVERPIFVCDLESVRVREVRQEVNGRSDLRYFTTGGVVERKTELAGAVRRVHLSLD